MKLKKKDVAKLFAVAAAIGAGAAATAVAVNRRNKRKAAEELKRLPKGRNIYFLGNSLSALFGAAEWRPIEHRAACSLREVVRG